MARYHVVIEGKEFDIDVEYVSEQYDVTMNGNKRRVDSHQLGESRSLLLVENLAFEVDVRSNGGPEKTVFLLGREVPVHIENYNLAQMRKTAGMSAGPAVDTQLKAPMPGMIVELRVAEGQEVKKGDALVVIEAMKMENVIKAIADMKVKATHVQPGKSVEKGDLLLEFE